MDKGNIGGSPTQGVRQGGSRWPIGEAWGVDMGGSAGPRGSWPPRGTWNPTAGRSGLGPSPTTRPWRPTGSPTSGPWRATATSPNRPWRSTPAPHRGSPRRPPRSLGPGFGLFLLVAATVVGGLVWRTASSSDIAVPPVITATAAPSAEPTSELPSGQPPDDGLPAWSPSPLPSASGDDHLEEKTAAIYAAQFPAVAGCPDPAVPADEHELVKTSTEQVRCLEEAWAPVLQALGIEVGSVRVFAAEEGDMGPCGEFTDAWGDYCTAGGGIIRMSVELLDEARPYLVKDVVNHEFGHRLQHLAGLFTQESMTELRRVELQAECLGWAQAGRDSTMSLDAQLLDELPWLYAEESDTHGSRESRTTWAMRGIYGETVGACNTWVAPDDWVS